MDRATHNKFVLFIFGIADEVPRNSFQRAGPP
jgi:hypothetical protein